jgi:nucleoid-associated protein YgaU
MDREPKGGRPMPSRIQYLALRLLILLVAVGAVFLLAGRVAAGQAHIETKYVVQSGDTLWRIAIEAAGEDDDIREVVRGIRELNRLETPLIRPGQILLVPIRSG